MNMNQYTYMSFMETDIHQYHKEIIKKWVTFFVLKQTIKCTVITKKI